MIRLLPQNLRPKKTSAARPVVVLGSSSSEVFDYIFGNQPGYHPFWAGGWSARGLRSVEHEQYLQKILQPISRDAVLLLNFGCTDIVFNFRHMAHTRGEYDFRSILDQAAAGIQNCKRVLNKMGFNTTYATFISPVISLPPMYWQKFQKGRQLPDPMRGRMYYDLAQKTSIFMNTIDIFDEVTNGSSGSYILKKKFMKERNDHHPDYIKIQHIVWEKLADIPGILPKRKTFLNKEYRHTHMTIKTLMKTGTTQPPPWAKSG